MWRVMAVAIVVSIGCTPLTAPSTREAPPARPRDDRPVAASSSQPIDPPAPAARPSEPASPAAPREPEDPRAERVRQQAELASAPRYEPEALAQAPRATRIKPGTYQCKISSEYRLRDCTVERTPDGHVMLTIPHALLAVRGVLWDEGRETQFAGWTTEPRPFGCFSCQEGCFVDPPACGCSEFPIEASRECLAQPVRFTLRGGPARWKGVLEYRMYHNDYKGQGDARVVVDYGSRPERFDVQLVGPPR